MVDKRNSRQKPVDVIAQYSSDGSIYPMRIRFTDEDGSFQMYNIHSYEEIPISETKTMPDGVYVVSSNTHLFRCKISIFNSEQLINLYLFCRPDIEWIMTI